MAYVIWLTGISGSGKTTLGLKLKNELEKKYDHVEFIDGDLVREFFENDLGYTRRERILNVKRIAFAAMLLARNGTNVIVANIAPYYEVRAFIREHIKDYIEIYLKISLKDVKKRDVKGYYKKHQQGKLNNFIGVDDNYDIPKNPDLIVETGREAAKKSLLNILDFLRKKGLQ